MAQINKANIEANAVDGTLIAMNNNEFIKARNFANNAYVNVLKLNASDTPEFGVLPQFGGSPLATQAYVGSNAITAASFLAKGGVLVGTGSGTFADLPVGPDGQVITADSTQTTGWKWAPPATSNSPVMAVDLVSIPTITLSGEQTIDGVLTSNSRVLVTNQGGVYGAYKDNGIYLTSSGAWTRVSDLSTAGQFYPGLNVYVVSGSNLSGSYWQLNTKGPYTIGTTPLYFSALSDIQQASPGPDFRLIDSNATFLNGSFTGAQFITGGSGGLTILQILKNGGGSRTLTIPNTAGTDVFTLNALSSTLSNKTMATTSFYNGFQVIPNSDPGQSAAISNDTQVIHSIGSSFRVWMAGTGYDIGIQYQSVAAKAVSTSNIASLSGTTTVDGVSLSVGDIVLLTAQSTASQNGPWVVQSSTWIRPPYFFSDSDLFQGYEIYVAGGTSNSNTVWFLSNNGPFTIGSSSLTFTKFSGSGGGITGSGTTDFVPKFTGSSAIGNSTLSESGSFLSTTNEFTVYETANVGFGQGFNVFDTGSGSSFTGYRLHAGASGASPSSTTDKGGLVLRSSNNNIVLFNENGGTIGFSLELDNATQNVWLVQDVGNLGIRNTSPQDLLDIGTAGTISGAIRLQGSSTGHVRVVPSASAGNWTFTLPPNAGAATGQILVTDSTGVTTWASVFVTLPVGTTDPSSSNPDGATYYNTSTNQLRVLAGGTWRGVTLT